VSTPGRISPEKLIEFTAAVYMASSVPEGDARLAADSLVQADLWGHQSHGVMRLSWYVARLRAGVMQPVAKPELAVDAGALAVLDGHDGMGQVIAARATREVITRAKAHGIGAVAVRNSNHYGAAGVYALRAAARGCLGLSTTAVYKPSIVPTFGRAPRLGTNPVAFAAPGRTNPPFLLDMATSTVAIGKLKLAAREGQPLPQGWALDGEGRPQTDPQAALADRLMTPLGGSRAMGGHKGYGLAAMVEVLSTLLGGAAYAPLRPPEAERFDVGHFCLALHPEAFREAGAFEADLDAFVEMLRATPPVDPLEPVLVPGDPEHAARERRLCDGIPVPASLLDTVRSIARHWSVDFLPTSTPAG